MDLRTLALDQAAKLERMARDFPDGEPGRKWLRSLATRLRNAYTRTRGQQKTMILKTIDSGWRQTADLVAELGFSRREVRTMLYELVESGYLEECSCTSLSGRGRPGRWFKLTSKAEELPIFVQRN